MGKTTKEVLAELDTYVFGHIDFKKGLITLLNRSYLRFIQKWYKGMDSANLVAPMKLLVAGASGTGKTHAVESLRKIVHFPYVRVDATQMLPSGGGSSGVRPNDLMELIEAQANYCYELYPEQYLSPQGAVDRMVIFVDEFDKLGHTWESSGNWNKHVQSNFLTIFDSKTELAGVSFVFGGAFQEITKKKLVKATIGFNTLEDKEPEVDLDDAIIKSGLIPELVGRINRIIKLEPFTEYDLYKILTTLLIPKKMRDLAAYGVFDAIVEESEIKELIEKSIKSDQGVRYMQRWLDKKFLELEFNADVDYAFKGYFNEC